jgi:WG containing repeat
MKKLLFISISFIFFCNAYSQKLTIFEKSLYKVGLKDSNGKVVVKPTFTGIHDNKTHFVLWNNKEGSMVMTYDGKILIPLKYRDLKIAINKNYYIATGYSSDYSEQLKGYVDLNGNEVIPVKYTDIEDYYKDKYLIVRNKYKWYGVVTAGEDGVINYKEIIPPTHIYLEQKKLEDGRIAFIVEDVHGKTAVFDGEGKMVKDFVNWHISLQISPTGRIISNGTLVVKDLTTKRYGLTDYFLNSYLPLEYDNIYNFRIDPKNYYVLYKDRKYGMADKYGKVFLETIYDNIFNNEGHAIILLKLNGKWGIKNLKGKQLQPFVYDDVKNCNGYYVDVFKDNKWTTIDAYTGKAQSDNEAYQTTADLFLPLQKKITTAIEDFAEKHYTIRNTKYTTEYELQKRYTELVNTKVADIKGDIQKARAYLTEFLSVHSTITSKDKDEINNVIKELSNTWNLLDKAKNYKDVIFATQKETVGGAIDEVLKKY